MDRMGTMVCPQHGARPHIEVDGNTVSVTTCCAGFKKQVLFVLAELMRTTR
jgi:hypothetical protein